MTGARCTGFNLWILLDHSRMNHSFDIYDAAHVPQLYERVYERAARSDARRYPGAGGAASIAPSPSDADAYATCGPDGTVRIWSRAARLDYLLWRPPVARGCSTR